MINIINRHIKGELIETIFEYLNELNFISLMISWFEKKNTFIKMYFECIIGEKTK